MQRSDQVNVIFDKNESRKQWSCFCCLASCFASASPFLFFSVSFSATHTPSLPRIKMSFRGPTSLPSLCCTLTLSRISSYRSVPPRQTAGRLIIHFIISPTAHTHTHRRSHGEASKHAGIHAGTQHRGTPKHKRQIIFQLKLKLPQTAHHALQLPTGGLIYQSMRTNKFLIHKSCVYTHESWH